MTPNDVFQEIMKLNKNNPEINLVNVSPKSIVTAFGDIDWDTYEIDGWDCDYWFSSGAYSVHGCMYTGTASISINTEEYENYDMWSNWLLRLETDSFIMIVHKERNEYRNLYAKDFKNPTQIKHIASLLKEHKNYIR